MKKRLFSALLAALMLTSTVTVNAAAESTEWTAYYEDTMLYSEEASDPEDDGASGETSEENSGESSEESSGENSGESSEESSGETSEESSGESSGETSGESSQAPDGGESSDPESSDDSEVVITVKAPVVKVSHVEKTGKVKLSWKAVKNAKKYKVYRSESKLTGYELMKTTDKLSYTNTNSVLGKKYYYKVKAVAADGTNSAFSTVVSARAQMIAPVVKASNVEKTGKIKLTWDKVQGASKYRVYRSTSKNGTYSIWKTLTARSYVDESSKAGQKYYYKVKAVPSNSALQEKMSGVVSRVCDLPRPVVKTSGDKESGKIVLSWEKVKGASEYKVYRCETKDGEYSLMKTVTDTTYLNKNAKPNVRYYYKVVAVHQRESATSAYSAVVNRLCDLAQPKITALANAKGKPEVKWDAVPGAAKYQVFRSNTKNGTYKLVYNTTATNYVNSAAEIGKTYYYKVKAIAPDRNADSVLSAADSCLCVKNSYKYTMSSFTTVKWADENRDTNLRVACEYIDGTILAPGEEFSFEDVVGPRVESRGFVMGSSIPEPTIGGGICQVATTVFNAALYANLKITDREQHSIACTFITPGRDAMIHSNWSDFCFVNDSDYYIKIQAKANGGYVTIKFLTREKGVSPKDDVSLKVLKTGTHEYVLVRRYKGVPNYYTYTKYEY